jgi:hypothetical protein
VPVGADGADRLPGHDPITQFSPERLGQHLRASYKGRLVSRGGFLTVSS